MSLAVLKRKANESNPRISPISGSKHAPNGFSLNGGYRNQGGVGQFRLIHGTNRTRFKGVEPIGNGGSGGKYTRVIYNSGTCSANDSSIVKLSSKSNAGMIDTKYKWINGGRYPRRWHKDIPGGGSGGTGGVGSAAACQSEYIKRLAQKAAAFKLSSVGKTVCDENNPAAGVVAPALTTNCRCVYYIGDKRKKITFKPITKYQPTAMSQGEYIGKGGVYKANCLPTPANKVHFPMYMIHNGCDVVYHTWQEAVAAGRLPANYVG